MKVLFITSNSDLYGANQSLLTLIKYLKQRGIVVVCVLNGLGSFSVELDTLDIPFRILKYTTSSSKFKISFLTLPRVLLRKILEVMRFVRLIVKEGPDLVYTNSIVVDQGLLASRITGRRHIWHIREFGDLDYSMRYELGRWVLARLLLLSDSLIAVSKVVMNYHLSHVSHGKKHVVYNGVVSREFALTKRDSKSLTTIAVVGLIHPAKGQEDAIRLLHKVKDTDIKLKIIGGGSQEYTNYLQNLCIELNVSDRVDFTGYLSDSYIIYQNIDLLLMCSRHEAMGRVTAEAMGFGVPVIGKKSGATPELIVDGYNGFLYSNLDELEIAFRRLYKQETLYETMSLNAHHHALKNFSIEVYVDKVTKIISNTI